MRNIPFFTTEYGVAELILESVPNRQEAFIHIHSTDAPEKLLEECREFCIACGAKRLYAAGDAFLEKYPFYMSVLQMNGDRPAIGETDAALFPAQEKTANQWRQIYNEKMTGVPKAAWISEMAMGKLVKEGNAYFVHREGQLLGIGTASGTQIGAVISVVPGAGAEVVRALCHALSGNAISLEVASTNRAAFRLYEKLGFVTVGEKSRWYQIL
ncbi:MAG: hypothetical protein E7462_05870 [Ruminococcaceae bacterium]|nr:hypothetical protein [Oscillospiraceae bacterium]